MKNLIPHELYEQYRETNAKVADCKDMLLWCKLFDPCSAWAWYVADYDPSTKIAFGYVEGLEKERGDFSIAELEAYTGRLGVGIERDLYFKTLHYHALVSNESLAHV